MRDGGFRHVPVVHEGLVIGIVSRGDFRGLEQDRLDEETGIWEADAVARGYARGRRNNLSGQRQQLHRQGGEGERGW